MPQLSPASGLFIFCTVLLILSILIFALNFCPLPVKQPQIPSQKLTHKIFN
uniref:ATP synthase F0 subunit 8 n=1 Tax=Gastrocopta cristata TaxID=1128339 RepID=A0A0A6ZAG7_9EUPU|nr:ATP synthase F0 subunit 8 [Gastrocopta cristata]AGC52857.1 ATP synthase F0 subunit 8 [Gastrocopta cristata]